MSKMIDAMGLVSELHKSHGIAQRGGKKYTQVVHRMEAFRTVFGMDCGVDTQILVDDVTIIVCNNGFDNHTLPIVYKNLGVHAAVHAKHGPERFHPVNNLGVFLATPLRYSVRLVQL